MSNRDKYNLLGWACLISSFIANFQLTLAIILALVIMICMLNRSVDSKDDSDLEDALENMNTSFEEIKELVSIIFMSVSSFIMWVVLFHKILMVI